MAMDCTPGTPRARSRTSCQAARISAGLVSVAGESAMRVTSTFLMLTPGSRDESRRRVRPSIPAETSSTTARAISEIDESCRADGASFRQRSALRRGVSVPVRARERAGPAPVRKEDRSRARRRAQTAARANRAGPLRRAANCLARTPRTGADPTAASRTPSRPPAEPQHRAFGETLAHQPAAARPERHAHGKFALARNRARQQQAGDIDAGDQQHQADRAQQQPERGAHIPTSGRSGCATKPRPLLVSGYCCGQAAADRWPVPSAPGPASRRAGGARRRPAGMRVATLHDAARVLAERGKEVGLVSVQPEAGGRDADHGIGLSVKDQRRADRCRASGEAALPQAVAQDGHRRARRGGLLRAETRGLGRAERPEPKTVRTIPRTARRTRLLRGRSRYLGCSANPPDPENGSRACNRESRSTQTFCSPYWVGVPRFRLSVHRDQPVGFGDKAAA